MDFFFIYSIIKVTIILLYIGFDFWKFCIFFEFSHHQSKFEIK